MQVEEERSQGNRKEMKEEGEGRLVTKEEENIKT